MLSDDSQENYEILYLLGEMPEKRLIQKFGNQIIGIDVEIDKDVVWDDISIKLPIKWILEEPDSVSVLLKYSGENHESKSFDVNEKERTVSFKFANKFDFEKFKDSNYNMDLEFQIKHPIYNLNITGKLKKSSLKVEKGIIGKSYNKIKSLVSDSNKYNNFKDKEIINFQIKYIETEHHRYVVSEKGDIEVI
jgi:hypothetical protein